MKRIELPFIIIAALATCVAARAAEPAQASGSTPAENIRSFYHWYVTELIANRDPMNNRTEIKRFVTDRLFKKIDNMVKGPGGLNADYFLAAQDFDNLWAKNISVSNVAIHGAKATADVVLEGSPGMRQNLTVDLLKDGAAWKIDKVQGQK